MFPLVAAEVPDGGHVVFLTSTIGGVVSDIKNPKQCIVYTDTFPDGVTVSMSVESFYDAWMTSLISEIKIADIEIGGDLH